MKIEQMFTPISIGNVTVENRFVMAPMGNNFADTHGSLSERSASYYEARARGGFGLITIEATVIDPRAVGGFHKPRLYDDSTVPGLRRVTDRCHAHGARVSVQLQHAGPESNPAVTGYPLMAASAVPSQMGRAVPEAVTQEQILQIAALYGSAAARARAGGADLVELHCAHGYFLHSFLSPRTNHRVDAFGGGVENRLRIISLILGEIRRQAGSDFPVTCRISGSDEMFGGITPEEGALQAVLLEEMGISALSVSRSVHLRDERMWAPTGTPAGFSENIFSRIRQAVSIPVTAVGRFTTPLSAELVIRQGKADLIAFGRQSIADPDMPAKARAGMLSRITPCVGCLQGCVPNMFAGEPITCMVNPAVGKEGPLSPAEDPGRILVVGAGPAGLTAAKVCAMRGHDVTLWEEQKEPGGQLRSASVPPGKGEYTGFLTALTEQAEQAGVRICLNRKADRDRIRELAPDTVILATGSQPVLPPVPGIRDCSSCFAEDVLDGRTSCGKDVLILGGGLTGLETAAFLGERRHSVTVVECSGELAGSAGPEHRQQLLDLLRQYHVRLLTDTEITCLKQNTAACITDHSKKEELHFNTLVISAGRCRKPQIQLPDGIKYHVIGDAGGSGNALLAIKEGYELGLRV